MNLAHSYNYPPEIGETIAKNFVISRSAEEILTMLLEASEEGMEGNWDGGRIVWSVRYAFDNGSQLNGMDQLQQRLQQRQMQQHHHHHHAERRKLQVRLEIQKDDIQAVLPISKVSFLSEVNSITF